ncbi:tyrosine-type recombinase/integrase [Halapricum desulfuricans]|uniref:XerD/XerC family integrase n=1 Tax=Halapricum desulfuricans TaxID=2841257 RepID=A0A897NAY5_9EURY|nr:tyrosine-type recombinase/integrase [Halapricum desulfuricans]QSG09561.1 XerD/XerC family integrase [Halapricum desulfuricans]
MSADRDTDCDVEYLGEESLSALNFQQKILYQDFWESFLSFLREKGKNPDRFIGYEESNIRPTARRVHQVYQYYWKNERIILELTPELADHYIENLDKADITTNAGDEYSEGGKRKFANSLEAYFRYKGTDWNPPITFGSDEPSFDSDPFTRQERELLLNTALDYKSPPSYANVSPEERDRWNAHIAQYLGKPKDEVSPKDWEELQRTWKFASIISTALDAGTRAKLIERLEKVHLDLENDRIIIPAEIAVKNDRKWTIELSTRSCRILKRWLVERSNKPRYDDTDALWLNRKGNRYDSNNLNTLLSNLMEDGGIEETGRTLTWHSIRHSTGMYVYDRERDLGIVAEILRQASLESAKKYAHPTPEAKRDVVEGIQGGTLSL